MKTISINGFDVPEPLRQPPEPGTLYFTVDYHEAVYPVFWDNRKGERQWLVDGICHLTREAAKTHCEALLSFTRQAIEGVDVVEFHDLRSTRSDVMFHKTP